MSEVRLNGLLTRVFLFYLSLLQAGLATSPAEVQQVVAADLGLYHPVQASLKVRLLSYYAIRQLCLFLSYCYN